MEQGHGKQEQHKDIVFPKPDTRAAVDQSSALQLQQTALAPYSPQKSSGPGFDKENERVSLREMFASNIPLSERKHLDELLEQACLPKPPILMVCLRCFTVKEKILTLGSDLWYQAELMLDDNVAGLCSEIGETYVGNVVCGLPQVREINVLPSCFLAAWTWNTSDPRLFLPIPKCCMFCNTNERRISRVLAC